MDNGPDPVSLMLAQWAEEYGVALEFIKPGKPTHNVFIERWLYEYNSERPHESLNNLTPEEYRLIVENPEISKSVWN